MKNQKNLDVLLTKLNGNVKEITIDGDSVIVSLPKGSVEIISSKTKNTHGSTVTMLKNQSEELAKLKDANKALNRELVQLKDKTIKDNKELWAAQAEDKIILGKVNELVRTGFANNLGNVKTLSELAVATYNLNRSFALSNSEYCLTYYAITKHLTIVFNDAYRKPIEVNVGHLCGDTDVASFDAIDITKEPVTETVEYLLEPTLKEMLNKFIVINPVAILANAMSNRKYLDGTKIDLGDYSILLDLRDGSEVISVCEVTDNGHKVLSTVVSKYGFKPNISLKGLVVIKE